MIRWERSINHRSIRQQESICDHLTPSPRFSLMSGLLVGRKISDGIPMLSTVAKTSSLPRLFIAVLSGEEGEGVGDDEIQLHVTAFPSA